MLTEEQKRILEELDEMLEAQEKFREEYGKKYEGITLEEKKKLKLQEMEETYDFISKTDMKIETIDMDKNKD